MAIITGASRGIGRATALAFAREGARVVVNYSKSGASADEVRAVINDLGGECMVVRADVSNSVEVKRMVESVVAEYGTVDILVNNAGVVFRKKFLDSTEADWDRTMAVNLKGAYLCSREVAPFMLRKRKGKIINVSSIGGIQAPPVALEVADYVTSKAGMLGLTRALAVNLAPHVNVNAVCPGYTLTDSVSDTTSEWRATRLRETPLKRAAQPEEIANAILFLASDDSDFITAETLVVAGGRPVT